MPESVIYLIPEVHKKRKLTFIRWLFMTGSVLEKFIWMIPFNFPELFHFTTEEIEEVIKLASDGPVFEVPRI